LRAAEADRERVIAARVRADERSRIARDVHDIVGHYASLIAVQASVIESSAPDEQTRHTAARVRVLSSRALDEMRSAVTGWVDRPAGGPDAGGWAGWVLQPAVAVGESGVDVRIERAGGLPSEVGEPVLRALRRVVQEGVTNAVKHSPGAAVLVTLGTEGSAVRLEVRNAMRERPEPARAGSGVPGLADRLGPLGGTVSAGPDGEGEWLLRAEVPVSGEGP
jgi:signal transduction histidine kinase